MWNVGFEIVKVTLTEQPCLKNAKHVLVEILALYDYLQKYGIRLS